MDQTSLSTDVTQDELLKPIANEQDLKRQLKTIKIAYKRGLFNQTLEKAAKILLAYYRHNAKQDTPEYYKGRTLLYELNDIFQIDSQICDETFRDGSEVSENLRSLALKHRRLGFMFSERRGLREKVLFAACYGHELQRRGEKALALETFESLVNFVEKFVQEEALPCYGLKATLYYHLGSVQRKLEQHHKAEMSYSKSLDLLHDRSANRKDLEDYFFVLRKQAMIAGLGFGLINLARGSLERAEHGLSTARSLLARSEDPLIRPYVDLYRGVIKRCRAGTNRQKLSEAIDSLTKAREAFKKHRRYMVHASWELALAKTLYNDFEGAEKDLQLVSEYALHEDDHKWRTNVHILTSRLFRRQGNYADALTEASVAVARATSHATKLALPLIDALITRGEAHLELAAEEPEHYSSALADFNDALRRVKGQDRISNPKIAAVCELRIAQIFAKQGNQTTALSHFSQWLRLEGQVEHEWVRELAVRVKDDIDKLSLNFAISATDETAWNYTDNVIRLRKWLLKRALRHTNNNHSEAARLIGVQRTTLYQWLANDETPVKRRGRVARSSRKV